METRKGSLWIGPGAQWKTDIAKVSFDVMGDALGKSKGIQAKLGAEHSFRAGPFIFMPHVAAELADKKYVDYYYGVRASEATAQRPAYDGRSTINFEGGLRTVFMLTPWNSIFADASVRRSARASPTARSSTARTPPASCLATATGSEQRGRLPARTGSRSSTTAPASRASLHRRRPRPT